MGRPVPSRQHAVKPQRVRPALRTPGGDAVSLLAVRIFQLNGRLVSIGDALTAPAGQSGARWQVLAAAEDSPRSVADIARLLGLARQSVQRVADLLVEEGLASYEANPQHRRAQLLCLTAAGLETLRKISRAQVEWANAIAEKLPPRDLASALETLERVLAALE